MAVWILDPHTTIRDAYPVTNELHFAIPQISVPYDLNQNARAQRGLFVDYLPKDRFGEDNASDEKKPVERVPFDDFLQSKGTLSNALVKLILPRREAPG